MFSLRKLKYFNIKLNSNCKFAQNAVFYNINIPNIKSWNIVFFGSDNFSIACLKALINKSNKVLINNVVVVTSNKENILYTFSISNNIKVQLWPPNLNDSFDLGVVASFGKLIPAQIIQKFKYGIINVHASLLPKWRGAMPIVYSIMNGDNVTGITIQKIKPDKFDIGDIVLKKSCTIGKNELFPSLYNRLCYYGGECLIEVIQRMPECLEHCVSQDNDQISYAKKFGKEICVVKWSESNAVNVYNLYRALFGKYILHTTWKGIKIKLLCLSLINSDETFYAEIVNNSKIPGTVTYNKTHKVLLVNCKDMPIKICTVMIKHNIYNGFAFYQGFLSQTPKKFWYFT